MSTQKTSLNILFGIALIIVLCPFLLIQGQYYVTGNVAWLYTAAERFLDGYSMVEGFYENNPPLSTLIYTPHVLIAHLTGIHVTWAIFFTTCIFVILSSLSVIQIISHFNWLNQVQKRVFSIAYIIGITINTSIFYAEREHFIIMLTLPFLVYQFALTSKIKPPLIISIIPLLGVIGFLIKPHYGLLPTLMILHRLIKQRKDINPFKQADLNALIICTASYILFVIVFFNDYVSTILPDVLALYANKNGELIHVIMSSQIHLVAYLTFFMAECFAQDLEKEKKKFVLFLYCAALINLVPYYVQLKGFYNHLIPAYVFFILAVSMSASFRISNVIPKRMNLTFSLSFVIVALLSWLISPLSTSFPQKADIPNLPVAKFLDEKCPKPCTFFAFHGDIEIFFPTALEVKAVNGTRFSGYWFLTQIIRGIYEGDDKPVSFYKSLKEKYSNYAAEDIQHFKPSVLLIAKDIRIGNVYGFNLVNSFSEFPRFRNAMKDYTLQDDIFIFDRGAYFTDTNISDSTMLEYQIYVRKN